MHNQPPLETAYRIHTLELGPAENFIYIIEDCASARAAVVDPAWDPQTILAHAAQQGLQITDILLTHSHYDHINGVEAILEAAPTSKLHLLKPEADFWQAKLERPVLHHGGDRLQLGQTEIELLHTPGHTPGSACFFLPQGQDLLAGDTLFVYGCGRCDLSGGDPEQMFHSLRRLRDHLPGTTCIRPGHNYSVTTTSTLDAEMAGNPFLHFHEVGSFVHYRQHLHDQIRHSPYHPVSAADIQQQS